MTSRTGYYARHSWSSSGVYGALLFLVMSLSRGKA